MVIFDHNYKRQTFLYLKQNRQNLEVWITIVLKCLIIINSHKIEEINYKDYVQQGDIKE